MPNPHAMLQRIPVIPHPDKFATIDDDKRELVAVEKLFSELLGAGGKLSDRGAELNARMTSIFVAMHGMLDCIHTQTRATRTSMAGPIRRWRAERERIAAWLAAQDRKL